MTIALTALRQSQPMPASSTTRLDIQGRSLSSRALAASLQATIRPFLSLWAKAPHLPWPMSLVDYAGKLLPSVKGTRVSRILLAECEAEWIRAEDVASDHVVLYLHGGAFVCCGLNSHRRLVSRVSQSVGAPVLSVDYRMMPRNPIAHAVEDGVDGYRFLLDSGYRPDQIFIAGDSAGGYLAFMVTLMLRDLGMPLPKAIFTMSPLTNLDPTEKLEHRNASTCAIFPADAIPALTVLADRVDARLFVEGHRGPRLSPVDADLTGLPPVLIQAGSTEILLADAELMAERLAEAGVDCELQVWEGQVHVFQVADFLPEAHQALQRIGTFVQAHSEIRIAAETA